MVKMPTFLLLTKTSDWSRAAQRFLTQHAAEVLVVEGERQERRPAVLDAWEGDYLVSFLSPWVLPAPVLARARRGAINFHPAPPEYPGIGCYNFALYDGVAEYGVTAHHMAAAVDSGEVIRVTRFPILPTDSVSSLKERSMACLLPLFQDVMTDVLRGVPLARAAESWTRTPYTRRQLDALCRVTPDMTPEEIHRRVRATAFPGAPGAVVELGGVRFAAITPGDEK